MVQGKSRILIPKGEIERRTDLQQELREKEGTMRRHIKCPKSTPTEETAFVGQQKANVHLEIRAHSSMNQTRKAMERDDLVHLLRQVHRTETRKVTEKVAMTEMLGAHQNFLVKVRQQKANRQPSTNFKKGSCQRGSACNYWHVLECAKCKSPRGCKFGDKSYKHTAKSAGEKKNSEKLLQFAIQRMMDD